MTSGHHGIYTILTDVTPVIASVWPISPVPRMRGDEPSGGSLTQTLQHCSPHARG